MLIEIVTALVASMFFPFGQLPYVPKVEKKAESFDSEQFEEKMKAQLPAAKANETLLASFYRNEKTFVYPDDYAGDYIDDDNKLHVLVTDEGSVDKYSCILADHSDTVIIDIVDHSFNELYSIAKEFADNLPKGSWVSFGVDIINNMGNVDISSDYSDYVLEKYDPYYDNSLEKHVYNDIIVLNLGCSKAKACSSYYAGNTITLSSYYSYQNVDFVAFTPYYYPYNAGFNIATS